MRNIDLELSADQLRDIVEPSFFKFKNTEKVEPLIGTIGQDRALEALEFGTGVEAAGYNIYASGAIGTGKETTVLSFIDKLAAKREVPKDWVYVNNFKDADRPINISLPSGMAKEFAIDIKEMIDGAKAEIPRAFESEEYDKRRTEILSEFQERRDNALTDMQEKAAEQGYGVEVTEAGIVTIPFIDGKPMKREEFKHLPERQQKVVQKKGDEVQEKINKLLRSLRQEEKTAKREVKKLDKEIALFAVGHFLEDLRIKYNDFEKILDYLQEIEHDIIINLEDFKTKKSDKGGFLGLGYMGQEPSFERYLVNVLVDNSTTNGAPIVFEDNPNYHNLFGKIEYRPEMGAAVTSFNLIKSGAIHRANGGYLIIRAYDLLTSPFAWQGLKRMLRKREIVIENMGEQFRAVPLSTIKPQAVPLNVKVVILGNPYIHALLWQLDEDFRKLFKTKADFTTDMEKDDDHIERYAQFIASQVQQKGFKHFDAAAVARVVEHGSWLAGDKQKLSTRFQEIGDLISESDYWAKRNGNGYVTANDVQNAIDHKIYRSNMIEERIQDVIKNNTIFIDTTGEKVGQANGLSIISLGDYYFGKPSRVTAQVGLGTKGIINIEREAKLGGPIYNKAVMILSGYLEGKYGGDKPLALNASLTFEQEYGGIEGDSASSTELYTILSALTEVPIRQDLAITGSINQKGEIQPIGGVNRKIEGFYRTAKEKGLTGEQGVIIPHANIRNLMLEEHVIKAVEDGQFHIYAVKSIDEGIEILTGKEAGERQKDGSYPKDTIHYMVDQKLLKLAHQLRHYGGGGPVRKAA